MGSFTLAGFKFIYPEGIKWTCKRCGKCCRDTDVRSRHILLLPAEVSRIGKISNMRKNQFSKKSEEELYQYEILKVKGNCLFLIGDQCSIYDYRPLVCRFYPFTLKSKGVTSIISIGDQGCPGIGSGPELMGGYYKQLALAALKFLRD
ncbi:MAG: YkgJ family cysteine cluster protein [Candidatus Bathyarchaeia archaeon]|nr:YkgJ family cysteine cluster protein [Candidatus Bathyarchaeota archaeon]